MRLFTAIELSEAVLDQVARTQQELQARGVRARWAAPARAHLTVHFLGERAAEELPAIRTALHAACAQLQPVDVAVGGLGKFRSGVLWLGVAGDLAPLEAACRRALGLPAGAYHPHITLARGFRGSGATSDAANRLQGFTVSELTLFRSELKPTGAVHAVVERFSLG